MTDNTVPNRIPPGADQLKIVREVTREMEDRTAVIADRQTANNRAGTVQTGK